VNVVGPHRLARAALGPMRERGGGTIVNVSSVLGRLSFPGAGAYAASKAALESASDALRAEVAPFGVDVVLVEPGPISTGFAARRERELEALDRTPGYEWVYDLHTGTTARSVLLGSPGPERVANAILDAATADGPPARVPVGRRVSALVRAGRLVSDRWRDAVFSFLSR